MMGANQTFRGGFYGQVSDAADSPAIHCFSGCDNSTLPEKIRKWGKPQENFTDRAAH
jgi:hypothetical protein